MRAASCENGKQTEGRQGAIQRIPLGIISNAMLMIHFPQMNIPQVKIMCIKIKI
jgi:hypothetical protein